MAVLEGATTGALHEVDLYQKGARVSLVPGGAGFGVAAITGTIAAALAANSAVFAMRLDPASPSRAFIEKLRLQFTTIVSFTVPFAAGRRLGLFRGTGAAASGGTTLATAVPKRSVDVSEFNVAQGGDIRIATTGALVVTGIVFETDPIRLFSLIHVGGSGEHYEYRWESVGGPIILEPGQLLAIRNPLVMGADGTWNLDVEADWYERAI